MSLPLSQVVDVTLQQSPRGAQKRDLSTVAIMTRDMCEDFQKRENRYITVSSANDVANLFGASSDTYKAAAALFSASPKPKTALIAKYVQWYQRIDEVPASINGGIINRSYIDFKTVTDGRFSFTYGGEKVDIAELNFSEAKSLKDVARLINNKLNPHSFILTFDEVGNRFILTYDNEKKPSELINSPDKPEEETNSEGEKSSRIAKKTAQKGAEVIIESRVEDLAEKPKFGFVYDTDATGTYIGDLLALDTKQGQLVEFTKETAFDKETPAEALSILQNQNQNFYGVYFACDLSSDELIEAHDWVTAQGVENAKILAYTETNPDNIEYTDYNPLKSLSKKNSGRLMVQYNNKGNKHAAAELLGIAVTTVWTGANTAKTVKFKQESSVESDDRITVNEANKCRKLGINFYTDFAGANMLAEGVMLGGTFIDETTGLDAFINAVQVQAFNTLQGQPSKIPQTDRGQEILISSLKVIGEQFINNGFLGEGTWTLADIGNLKYGDRINGYYFFSNSFATQDTADREARKMMPINCALKLAGAGHSVDVIVQFNR